MRIERLEKFLRAFIPLEDGVAVVTEYEDGSSILAVTGSAWVLTRAYVEAGQKEKALKMIDWLQEHDSKSELVPTKPKSEQGAEQPATRSESKSAGKDKPKPESEERPR